MSELIMTEEAGTPSTPGAGKRKIYPKSDGWYAIDDAGTEIGPLNVGNISINAQTGTTYTTVDGDNNKIVTLNNASPITVTVHSGAAAGFNCLLIQKGAGQVTIAAGGTGNVRNKSSHTKISGQYGMASIVVESNAGTAPEVYLGGDTGT